MKILLTGPFGNLGGYVLAELLQQGHDVRCFDLDTPAARAKAAALEESVEVVWGDLCDAAAVRKAVKGVEAVVHLAALIPPISNLDPDRTRSVNVDGTRNLLEACKAQPVPPRFFFASSFDLFGHTRHLPPPRSTGDPVQVTDVYTETKIAGEELVRASGLDWLIFRFSDMPLIALRSGDPIMYEIPLDQRFETMHPADGALALVNALNVPELWGNDRLLLVGGGPKCQVTYRQFLFSLLTAMGIGTLPEEAFTQKEYVTDWLDTEESQRLLQYQRHSFEDIVNEIAGLLGWKKFFVPLARPFARQSILKLSPYLEK